MKWKNNIINIGKNNNPGKCPFCGSSNTDYGLQKNDGYEATWGTIWCNDCRHGYHLSRVLITRDSRFCEQPNNLIY